MKDLLKYILKLIKVDDCREMNKKIFKLEKFRDHFINVRGK